MGRFYSGNIEGKFWVGVQCSNDIENLVNVAPSTCYAWKVCNCVAEIDVHHYCEQCYETKEEHIDRVNEEYDDDDDDDDVGCLYYTESSQAYDLDEETHYHELADSMNELKTELGEMLVQKFDAITQNDDILRADTGVFNSVHEYYTNTVKNDMRRRELDILVARYTLGYQLEYCLRTNGTCSVVCEY